MIKYLITHFVKNYKNTSSPLVKQSYATLCSTVGVALNVLLFIVKVIVGTISGSLSIVADGVNNITDAGSSLATLGFRLAQLFRGEKIIHLGMAVMNGLWGSYLHLLFL